MKPDAPKTVVDFANDYPHFMWLWEYLSFLAEHFPDAYPEPPSEQLVRTIASYFATRNYCTAYLLSGYVITGMVIEEFEQLECFEECAEIQSTVEANYSFFNEVHKAAQEGHYGTSE